MSGEKHEHSWLPWSEWAYGGYDTDMQIRDCDNEYCSWIDARYRQHVHDYSGGTDSICLDCGKPE